VFGDDSVVMELGRLMEALIISFLFQETGNFEQETTNTGSSEALLVRTGGTNEGRSPAAGRKRLRVAVSAVETAHVVQGPPQDLRRPARAGLRQPAQECVPVKDGVVAVQGVHGRVGVVALHVQAPNDVRRVAAARHVKVRERLGQIAPLRKRGEVEGSLDARSVIWTRDEATL